jgi:hypothetical protein
VGDGDLRHEGLVHIDGGSRNLLSQTGDLSNFLEEQDLASLIAIDPDSGRVVSTVLLASKASAQDLKNFLTALKLLVSKGDYSGFYRQMGYEAIEA